MDELERYRHDQARAWLEHVRALRVAVSRSQAMVEVMERIADAVGGVDYSRERVDGGAGARPIEEAIMRLEDQRAQWAANRAAYGAEAVDASNRIAALADPNEVLALTLHYLDGETWEQVAYRMGYSEQRIYQIRESGVVHCWEVMPLEWRDRVPRADA